MMGYSSIRDLLIRNPLNSLDVMVNEGGDYWKKKSGFDIPFKKRIETNIREVRG